MTGCMTATSPSRPSHPAPLRQLSPGPERAGTGAPRAGDRAHPGPPGTRAPSSCPCPRRGPTIRKGPRLHRLMDQKPKAHGGGAAGPQPPGHGVTLGTAHCSTAASAPLGHGWAPTHADTRSPQPQLPTPCQTEPPAPHRPAAPLPAHPGTGAQMLGPGGCGCRPAFQRGSGPQASRSQSHQHRPAAPSPKPASVPELTRGSGPGRGRHCLQPAGTPQSHPAEPPRGNTTDRSVLQGREQQAGVAGCKGQACVLTLTPHRSFLPGPSSCCSEG